MSAINLEPKEYAALKLGSQAVSVTSVDGSVATLQSEAVMDDTELRLDLNRASGTLPASVCLHSSYVDNLHVCVLAGGFARSVRGRVGEVAGVCPSQAGLPCAR